MIPKHQRHNYERTNELLNDLDCLMIAMNELQDLAGNRDDMRLHNAAYAMRYMAMEKFLEVEKSRQAEWVGLGGKSPELTDAETAAARGEEASIT